MVHLAKEKKNWRIAFCGKEVGVNKQKDGVLVFGLDSFEQSINLPKNRTTQRICSKCLSHYKKSQMRPNNR